MVFGKASGFAAEIDLAAVAAGNGGFVIHGQDGGDVSGSFGFLGGDVNGDGFDDLIIGADGGDGPGNTRTSAGDSYVVFGHAGAFAAEIDLAALAGGAAASSSMARRPMTSPALRYPRPATSMATASTT